MTSLGPMMLHSRAELDTWVATIEDRREELEALMKRDLGVDRASLDALEKFLLKRYKSIDAALALDQRGVIDAAARVVGTALLLSLDGARWDINLDKPKYVDYRLPVVAMPDGFTQAPLTMVTASLDRRTGTYLSEIVENLAELYAKPMKKKPAKQPPAKRKPAKRR